MNEKNLEYLSKIFLPDKILTLTFAVLKSENYGYRS